MTREELHQKVWAQPMRTLAKSMGISDVALAKRCRVADIPVPPRGWWARKEAGKTVKITPLPEPRATFANYFPAREADIASEPKDDAPAQPRFRDLAAVQDEIRAMVKAIKVPSDLESPHPAVARLLKQDAERKPTASPSRFLPDRNGPKFATAIQQRRLRVLSAILTELVRLGCKIDGHTHAGERFSVQVGGYWTYIFFGVEGGAWGSYFNNDGRRYKAPDRPQLRFDITDHSQRSPPKRTWREDDGPLERQAAEIVRGLLLQAEEDTRELALMHFKWTRDDNERRAREAKRAAEQAEANRIAREKAQAAARIDSLLGGADALERAVRIRRYVAAVRAARLDGVIPVPREAVEEWAQWALAQADAIDPVLSGQFASSLDI